MQGPPNGYYGPPRPPGPFPPRPPMPPYGFAPPPMGMPPRPPFPMPPAAPAPNHYGPPPVAFPPPVAPIPVADPATLPLTIYVGKIPASFDEAFMQQLLGVFGTVTKWNRAPGKAFGFATFTQGISALQCFTVLNGFEVDGEAMLSKAGSKEQIVLDELRKKQQETNAEGFAEELKELRSRVQTLIMQRDMMGMIDGADGTASPPAQSNLPMQIEGSGAEGERKTEEEEDEQERFLRQELEQFRAQQAARDRQREEMRRAGLEAKKRKLLAAQRAEADAAARAAAAAAAAAAEQEAEDSRSSDREASRGRSRGRSASSSRSDRRDRSRSRDSGRRRTDEDEAAIRRRQEVLAKMASSELEQETSQLAARTQVQLKLQPGKPQPKKGYQPRAFVEEDEHAAQKQVALIPIDFTEDELMATVPVSERLAAAAAKITASMSSSTTKVDKNKELVERIPQNVQELYSFPIDWALLRQENVIETRIRPWVAKKVSDYLGEEVEDFIDFVVKSVERAVTPKELEGEVRPVLDQDTEPFVSNLWRMLVFYQLKIQEGK